MFIGLIPSDRPGFLRNIANPTTSPIVAGCTPQNTTCSPILDCPANHSLADSAHGYAEMLRPFIVVRGPYMLSPRGHPLRHGSMGGRRECRGRSQRGKAHDRQLLLSRRV